MWEEEQMPIISPSTLPSIPSAIGVLGARATVKINCGCGFRTDSVPEGLQHAERYGHSLEINGEIRPVR